MRIGEILVVSTGGTGVEDFLKKSSSVVEKFGRDVHLGLLPIDEQIVLHLYGVQWTRYAENYPWQLLVQKALGVLVLFDWDFPESVREAEKILEFFQTRFQLPVVIASVLKEASAIRIQVYRGGLTLTKNSRFTLYTPEKPESLRQLVVDLININLEQLAV